MDDGTGVLCREIQKDDLTCKLLYVTPEQLTCNKGLIDILRKQQAVGNFKTIVVDEVRDMDVGEGSD